ncbi:unnamed protein product [Bathycoccus prasinos]
MEKEAYTLYINNLNERVNETELRKSLYAAFSHLGRIEKISTATSYRARGQAWIAFGDNLVASEALATMQNFLLYSKPMKLAFANSTKAQSSKISTQSSPLQNSKDKKNESKGIVEKVPRENSSSTRKDAESPSSTLLVEGLPGATTEQMLSILFKQFVGFVEIRIDKEKPGVAFAKFGTANEAGSALVGLQGFRINATSRMQLSLAKEASG